MVCCNIIGAKCRQILEDSGSDIDLSPANFPFMSMKHAHIGGLPARIFRISFTGELSYEINVAPVMDWHYGPI